MAPRRLMSKGHSGRAVTVARVIGLVALLGLVGPAPTAADDIWVPAGEEFSVRFGPDPKLDTSTKDGELLETWSARADNIVYIASHTVNSRPYNAEGELAADVSNFVKETQATILDQRHQAWPMPHGTAAAVRFAFKTPNGVVGEGVFIVDQGTLVRHGGDRSCARAAAGGTEGDRQFLPDPEIG